MKTILTLALLLLALPAHAEKECYTVDPLGEMPTIGDDRRYTEMWPNEDGTVTRCHEQVKEGERPWNWEAKLREQIRAEQKANQPVYVKVPEWKKMMLYLGNGTVDGAYYHYQVHREIDHYFDYYYNSYYNEKAR